MKRLFALLVLPVLALVVLPSASAQEEPAPALQPVVDGLNDGLAQIDEALGASDALEPVSEPIATLIGQLAPLFDALQTAIAAAEPACAVVYEVDGDHGVVAMHPDRFVPALVRAARDVARRAALIRA